MTLKIHGYPGAISTQRVINICHELELDYTFILVDFKTSAQRSPEYLALQPFGKVPLLEDDGFFVHESRAICKYLAIQYATRKCKLIPNQKETKDYALFEQVSLQNQDSVDKEISGELKKYRLTLHRPAQLKLNISMAQWQESVTRSSSNRTIQFKSFLFLGTLLIINRRRGINGDEAVISKLTATLETVLAAYETILAKQNYLAGHEVTLADLYHLPYGTLTKSLGFAEMFSRFPHVNEWFDGLSRRQSWVKTVQE